ncbi:MAG: UDP-N-acetylmuramoyl-L-alanyl-D-glutamate--2,6-diaminopimelate ligase [Lachnospiraceae bacterium]|nr:UDP-N-acetylmuramoyl-L-alanyl-D-glutamate--2,6-diaminopimelate ligase [Lachnospiraceae bacterium]
MVEIRKLFECLDYELVRGSMRGEISEIVYDSRKVVADCLFVCITGAKSDGHDYAPKAVEGGAKVIVVEKNIDIPEDVTVIKVADSREALALLSASFFGNPSEKMRVIGVTGTKGKTTTTYMIKSILDASGHKCGLIGTIETIIGERSIPSVNTTPESYYIQKYLREMLDQGCDCAVMEVSSQGLMLARTAGILFDIGIFTNLSPDHIGPDEHRDFDHYLHCKSMLFKQCKIGIFNIDDPYYERVLNGHGCSVETFGFSDNAGFQAYDYRLIHEKGRIGVDFKVKGIMEGEFELNLPGKFSIYNALAAIAVCRIFGVPDDVTKKALKKAHVKGRIEPVKVSDDFSLMIDYAHNAFGLESLLTTLKEYEPRRLVCLFGCGGNRDRNRRFEMGEVSGKYADLSIITSDNPRYEKPEDIIEDIITGISKTKGQYVKITDRKEAIAYAIHNGQPGDVIVLAGKGHEDYQEIEGVKYPMDERDIIRDILEADAKS